jgi:hypothetical protein
MGRHGGAAPLVALAVAALVVGCSAPRHRFVASPEDDVVIEVPRSWTKVYSGPPRSATGATAQPGAWLAVYDSARTPKVENVENVDAAQPVALMRTFVLDDEEAAAVTDDVLRDIVLPVTDSARAQAALTGKSPGEFRLLDAAVIASKAARGIHVVYVYDFGRGEVVYDQVAVTDARRKRLYLFFVHCTKACYDAHRGDISAAVSSVTLKPL